jgi:hypothetical protein
MVLLLTNLFLSDILIGYFTSFSGIFQLIIFKNKTIIVFSRCLYDIYMDYNLFMLGSVVA